MTYTKNIWKSGDTLTAVNMNNIETGLEAVAQELSNVTPGLSEEEVKALAQSIAQEAAATAVAPKLDTVVYEADKVTFALKSELPDVNDFVRSGDVYTKGEIDAKLVGAMIYKGAVETQAQLPQDAKVGDIYDVTETGHNFAWNGKSWDDLGGSIDLSGVLTKEEAKTTYQPKGDYQPVGEYALKSEVAVKLDTTTYEADKATFAMKSEIPSVEGLATTEALTRGLDAKADSEHTHELADVTDINKLVNPTFLTHSDPSETVQYLPKLEQSYVDKWLKPSADQGLVTINGKPWHAETNNWTIDMPYVIFGHFNESHTVDANLWSADPEHLGVAFNQVKSMIGTFYAEYQLKVKSIEERLKALESK